MRCGAGTIAKIVPARNGWKEGAEVVIGDLLKFNDVRAGSESSGATRYPIRTGILTGDSLFRSGRQGSRR